MFDAGLAAPEQPVYIRPAAGQAASTARRWHLTIAPERVAGWIAGRRVEMMLTDGTYLKGTVARADTRSIEVAVGDSSEKSYRKRRVEVSVDRLAAVTYRENVGGNRFAATLAGALTGLCAGALAASAPASDSADEKPLVFGGGAGVMAGGLTGFGLARHYNSREITLSVVRSRP